MNPVLPEPVRRALDRPELAILWQRARKQLEKTGGEPRGTVTVPVTDLRTASELGAVLGRRLARRVGGSTQVNLCDLDRLLRAGAAQCGLTARTRSWAVYDAAVRAACIWWAARGQGRRMAAKELAGEAFKDTKKWTDQRRLAFANLVHLPFDQAVDEADIPIRLSGPLVWTFNDTVADAAAAHPWIAVPAEGIRKLGYISCSAQGILVIENSEAFEKVCLLDDISDRWLCVWNQGNPSKRLMRFLAELNLPIAAWCDLDAYGIRMIHNLQKEIGQPITPVGMSADLWRAGTKLDQTDEQLALARRLAAHLAVEGPQQLRALAAAIAETGDCCEQETLYRHVLPSLFATLGELECA